MTTLQTSKDPHLRGVSPKPSKIPVLSQRCPDFSSVKSRSLDQENQDPRRPAQKPPLSTQRRPLTDTAGLRSKTLHQTERSPRLSTTQLRNPLEELKPSSGESNVGLVTHPQTEATGAIEFVADPAALATILSGEGVKSCPQGYRSSLAQRVLVRERKGSATQRDQSARSSAYLARRITTHQVGPARASCFSRLEGPGLRDRTLSPQTLEALNPPPGSSHSSTRPSLQELRRKIRGGDRDSRTPARQALRILLKTPLQPASSSLRGEHKAVPHSSGGGRPHLGLAQRVPVKESLTHTMTTCSSMKRFTIRRKTQFTPLQSPPTVQQAQWLSGLSPHSSPEEPALPWEQIAVKLFDQESYITSQKGPGKPSVASTSGPHPKRTPSHQELRMQRIHILQQLLQQEVEGLAAGSCTPLNGGSALDMTELQPLVAEMSRTLNAPEHNSGTSLLELSKHSGVTQPLVADREESHAEKHGEPQACPGEGTKAAQPCPTTDLKPPMPHRAEPEPPEPCLPALSGPPLPSCPEQAEPPEAGPRIELGASAACSLEAGNQESSPQPCCSQGPPATTSLIFSSQSPVCASPPIHSLRSPTGHSGPSSVVSRTLALRQRLRACFTTIHCFHEALLDDECAFYTSRAPPPGPTRVCTNPVATMLEWQDALRFVPVGPVGPQDSPS
ncbi:tastin [Apodemus sylvaticus]|uniref:tastin n=1 Tax=Apodemus sylvaticus TaxID=10129 RepID=UPI0022440269|nr:tastin [Apodemus sylvaticus]XP_052017109.1 tastin [Apodemus sylvaticus]